MSDDRVRRLSDLDELFSDLGLNRPLGVSRAYGSARGQPRPGLLSVASHIHPPYI